MQQEVCTLQEGLPLAVVAYYEIRNKYRYSQISLELISNSSGGSQAQGHYPRKPRKIPRTPAEPRRDPAEPSERPRRALGETPAEPSERQISSESLAEGCAPRMVTLRNFKIIILQIQIRNSCRIILSFCIGAPLDVMF